MSLSHWRKQEFWIYQEENKLQSSTSMKKFRSVVLTIKGLHMQKIDALFWLTNKTFQET